MRVRESAPVHDTNIPPEAVDRLADALEPLAGHAPGHSEGENVERMKAAQDVRPAVRVPRPPAVTTADFTNMSSYPFGMTVVAAGLRRLADAVERGDVNPQRVVVEFSGAIDDFHETTLKLVYNERVFES